MGATLEQLYQEMKNLRKSAAEVGTELQQILKEYMSVLERSVPKQLVLSSFHLCTQVYPEAFVALSVSERESLQKGIQSLGTQLAASLLEVQIPLQEMDLGHEVNPLTLLEGWENAESALVEVLREGTHKINQLLIDSHIMTVKSLDNLLTMAGQAQDAGRTITNPPNLLKAMVDPRDMLEESIDPVIIIYLQISDLEFTDAELMSWRQKLRPLRQKLTQLQQSYAQKQEEQLTAEAIAAWRASWTETGFLNGGLLDG
jgi:hypothetical protein